MRLFGGHYLVNNDVLRIGIEKYSISIRHMHPVAFLGSIETLYISMYLGKINKTIYVFGNYPTILFMKISKKIFNTWCYLKQKLHSVIPSSCFALSHGIIGSEASIASRSVINCNR
jgi:hypothetical protein